MKNTCQAMKDNDRFPPFGHSLLTMSSARMPFSPWSNSPTSQRKPCRYGCASGEDGCRNQRLNVTLACAIPPCGPCVQPVIASHMPPSTQISSMCPHTLTCPHVQLNCRIILQPPASSTPNTSSNRALTCSWYSRSWPATRLDGCCGMSARILAARRPQPAEFSSKLSTLPPLEGAVAANVAAASGVESAASSMIAMGWGRG